MACLKLINTIFTQHFHIESNNLYLPKFDKPLKMFKHMNLIEIGMFDPSSKMCSKCIHIKHELNCHITLCDFTIDIDLNAAINIKNLY